MNTIATTPLSDISAPAPKERVTERDDLRRRLIRLIADREAAKHVERKEIRRT
jgi:hypothetical protein